MLTHKGTQTITTERLTLRKFVIEDAKAMFDNWAKDERVTKYLTWPPHENLETAQYVLSLWCDDYKNDNFYQWAVVFEGEVVGSISVVRISDENEYAELGYCLGYDYWGKGIMTEAFRAVIKYLFEEIGFNQVRAAHAVKNPASGKVMEKRGLTLDGTFRQFFRATSGELLDISYRSILREDYFADKELLFHVLLKGYTGIKHLLHSPLTPPFTGASFLLLFLFLSAFGVFELVVELINPERWLSLCRLCSLALHAAAMFLFAVSRQPYVTALLFLLFVVKVVLLIQETRMK